MPLILFVLFLLVPLVELTVIIQVGQAIGVPTTIVLLLAISVAGAILLRREGTRAWRRFRDALAEVRLPTNEVVDGALVVLGGALMLTPGFVTDAVGLVLVIPFTRPVIRRLVTSRVRLFALGGTSGPTGRSHRPGPDRRRPTAPRGPGADSRGADSPGADSQEVVDIEVVSIERNDPPERPDA